MATSVPSSQLPTALAPPAANKTGGAQLRGNEEGPPRTEVAVPLGGSRVSGSGGGTIWPSRFWAELSARDFAAAQNNGLAAQSVALLPVAAIEQHGPHLPLSVDATLAQGVINAALPLLPPELPLLCLPPQNIGLSIEHSAYAGTLTLTPTTLLALWSEIGACVARAGVRKLLIFNGHGGQVSAMDIVARELRVKHRLLVYSTSWFGLVDDAANQQFCEHEHRFGIHGGEVETSMMLYLAPESVRMENARNFASTSEERAQQYALLGNGRSAKLGWAIQDYNRAGAVGNAAAATAERGAAMVEASAKGLAQLLQEIYALPESTLVDEARPY